VVLVLTRTSPTEAAIRIVALVLAVSAISRGVEV
jgi:hypothetical protein